MRVGLFHKYRAQTSVDHSFSGRYVSPKDQDGFLLVTASVPVPDWG